MRGTASRARESAAVMWRTRPFGSTASMGCSGVSPSSRVIRSTLAEALGAIWNGSVAAGVSDRLKFPTQ